MSPSANRFYRDLTDDYGVKIRQLVPLYDDLVDSVVDLVAYSDPGSVLDVGAGTGIVARRLLDRLPTVRVTLLDPMADMLDEARALLDGWGDRVSYACNDVRDYIPEGPFEAIFSNLVLHNVPDVEKPGTLARIREWLAPDGVFVWGDFIRHASPELQSHFVARRVAFARASGCPEALVRANFDKEARDDHPLTPAETLSLLADARFEDAHVAWLHDTFAVFWSRRAR